MVLIAAWPLPFAQLHDGLAATEFAMLSIRRRGNLDAFDSLVVQDRRIRWPARMNAGHGETFAMSSALLRRLASGTIGRARAYRQVHQIAIIASHLYAYNCNGFV